MKADFIADTNFFIYVHEGNEFIASFLDYNFSMSFISEVELLGYKDISESEEKKLRSLISDCFVIEWSQKLKEKTIEIRKKYSIKLPDAIIASTSIVYEIPLVTADKSYSKIKELDLILLEF
jgi:predicted nucleic acid-binding protein